MKSVDKYSFMYGVAEMAALRAASTALLSSMYEAGSSFLERSTSVSYTHLTLPTILLV